jgi:hypothetical protein
VWTFGSWQADLHLGGNRLDPGHLASAVPDVGEKGTCVLPLQAAVTFAPRCEFPVSLITHDIVSELPPRERGMHALASDLTTAEVCSELSPRGDSLVDRARHQAAFHVAPESRAPGNVGDGPGPTPHGHVRPAIFRIKFDAARVVRTSHICAKCCWPAPTVHPGGQVRVPAGSMLKPYE